MKGRKIMMGGLGVLSSSAIFLAAAAALPTGLSGVAGAALLGLAALL